jgi:hypothetical protein
MICLGPDLTRLGPVRLDPARDLLRLAPRAVSARRAALCCTESSCTECNCRTGTYRMSSGSAVWPRIGEAARSCERAAISVRTDSATGHVAAELRRGAPVGDPAVPGPAPSRQSPPNNWLARRRAPSPATTDVSYAGLTRQNRADRPRLGAPMPVRPARVSRPAPTGRQAGKPTYTRPAAFGMMKVWPTDRRSTRCISRPSRMSPAVIRTSRN